MTENAIEYVSAFVEEDKRFVRLMLRRSGAFVSLRTENYFEGELKLKNGLPQTTKNGGLHGYGTKSMRMITEKYGGTLDFSAEDGIFAVTALFLQKGR